VFRAISRVALVAVLGVLAPASLAVPVLAISPNVTLKVSASPSPQVSPNKAVMFIAQMTYTGFSQSNHASASSSAPGAIFVNSWINGAECQAESCSLGSLVGGGSAQLLFLYRAPASGSVTGTISVTTSEGSRGNTFSDHATVGVEANIDLGVARLLPESVYPGLATVDTGLTGLISTDDPLTNNPHGTQLTYPGAAAQGTLATVQDLAAEDSPCPRSFKSASKCFGGGSYLSVPDVLTAVPYLKVTAAWSAGELRNGVNEKTIQVVHIFDGTAHLISTFCSSATPGASELPCRLAGYLDPDDGTTVLVPVYLTHNGLIKGL
jgi:hypothetical protein